MPTTEAWPSLPPLLVVQGPVFPMDLVQTKYPTYLKNGSFELNFLGSLSLLSFISQTELRVAWYI